jgi:hypothetical protein
LEVHKHAPVDVLRKLLTWAKITEECSPTCQQLYFTVVCGTEVPSKSSIKMLLVSNESHFSLHCESLHGEVKNEKQTLKTVTMSKCMANSTAYGNLLCAVAPYCQTMLEELQADESRFYSMWVSRAQGKSVTGFSMSFVPYLRIPLVPPAHGRPPCSL